MPAEVKPKIKPGLKKSSSKAGAGDSLSREVQAVYDQCLAANRPVDESTIRSFLPPDRNDVEATNHVINQLLSRRLLETLTTDGTGLVWRAISQTEARRMGGMTADEAMVYQYIKDAGDQGIWSKQIGAKTNLHTRIITKSLKSLESRSHVKCVQSVSHPTRKIYMLYDLTPNTQVSGGPWYTDGELDMEFVTRMTTVIERYIRMQSRPKSEEGLERIYTPSYHGYPSAQAIHAWLVKSDLTVIELSVSDVTELLNVLIYDGKIEKHPDGISYKSVQQLIDNDWPNAFTDMPCGQCPVFNICQEGGIVSPQGCQYWQEWLNGSF